MRKKLTKNYSFGYLLLVFALCPVSGQCGVSTQQELAGFEALFAVDNKILDAMCGGYMLPDGMKIDIGIGRATLINDSLQLQNSLVPSTIFVNGHSISAANMQDINSAVKTIIQNNLDNKTIQNFTVMDVNVKNFGGFMESMKNSQDIRATQDMQVIR